MTKKLPEEVRLPMWKGYRPGPDGEASTGVLRVDHHGRVTPQHVAALEGAVRRAKAMQPRILEAIVEAYPRFRAWDPRPKKVTAARLKTLVEPWELLVSSDRFEGEPYVVYGFSCAWDPSGIHVITHRDRVVVAGDWEVLETPYADPMRAPPKPKGPSAAKMKAAIARAKKRAAKNPTRWPDGAEEVAVFLPAWAGFVAGDDDVADGEVLVRVGGDVVDAELGPAQQAAFRRVVTGAKKMQECVLDAIAGRFAELTRGADVALPKVVDRAALRGLVSLVSVHLHTVERDGIAYVGYELACAWDGEHGVGVMTHGERVVEVGHADTAILAWIAERDRKKKSASGSRARRTARGSARPAPRSRRGRSRSRRGPTR